MVPLVHHLCRSRANCIACGPLQSAEVRPCEAGMKAGYMDVKEHVSIQRWDIKEITTLSKQLWIANNFFPSR